MGKAEDRAPSGRGPLLDIVRERPIEERPTDPVTCPYCGSVETRSDGVEQTLIGWSGEGWDPNHAWDHHRCRCGKQFVRESKSGNVWYTTGRIDARVLRGMPSCFERYTYTCAACAGPVERRYARLDGQSPVHILGYTPKPDGRRERDFRIFYECRACRAGREVDEEHWSPPRNAARTAAPPSPDSPPADPLEKL